MMESKVLIGILLCLFVVQLSASGVTISGSSPSGSNVNGRILVAVTGCGFRQYNQAVCTWDYQYFSPIHVIVSDDLIYCETPQLQKGDFEVLPKTTSLYVYFDGDRDNSVLISSNYVFGPSIQSYTPYDGYVNGGEDFKVVGKGFSEFSFVNVTFDDVQCINTTILNDHEITCVVPPGEFNQNAIVNVMFEDNPNYFLHFTRTFHYGPILYGVNPPCGSVVGGTRVTILGTNLDDPILAVDADPAGYTPEVEVIFNGGLNRTYALDIEFNPSSNLVTFTTPEIGVVFGEEVQFAVFFKTVFSKVDVTSLNNFVYGPIVYNSANYGNYLAPIQNPSISSGSLGGGESITIYGCGLSEWNATQYNVLYQGSTLCESGSINVYELDNSVGDYLTCTVAAQDCNYSGSDAGEVYVQLNTTIDTVGVQVLPPSSESPLSYSVGPVVDASTLNPTRGPRTGGQVVTIQGQNLFYSASNSATTPGWTVTVNFLYPSDASVNIPSVTATFVSNTELTFVSPVGLFDLDVEVSLDFGSTCLEYPRDSSNPTYHFGPVCNQVTPTNGYYSGNSRFTVIGEGFQEDDNLVGDTFVRLCLDRLSTSDTCAYEESPRSSYSMNSTHISLLTPSSRQNVATKVGNNRLFGDVAEVYVHFYQPGGEFIEFPRNQLRPGLEVARIACPNYYTFAPEVTTLSPTYGQVVERSDDPETNELVISGTYFNDPTLENDISVVFESSLIGVDSTIQNDNTLTTNVTWGLTANSDSIASVIFDNSNMTYSGVNVGFGPAIYNIYASKFGYPVVDEYNPNGDIYGLSPNGGDTIVVEGEGFLDYGSEVKCVIEGDDATVYIDSDTQIRCITPCRPFGAKGSLALMFGSYCGSSEVNWENVIYASQALYYNPRIDYFTPSYGRVSGGDTVTLKGEGFYGWGKYECFFGHYSDQQHVIPTNNGTTVVCKTPINRAEFNTYVTVHVQLAAEDDDDTVDVEVDQISNCFDRGTFDESVYAGVENHDEKVWASSKFYYGPVCTDISPSSCPLGGCSATLVGSGFQDCVTGNQSIYTQTYPYNDCIFRYYRVRFVDPSTGDVTYVDSPTNDTYNSQNSDTGLVFTVPSGACGYEPEIEIEFYTPVISTEPSGTSSQAVIQCSYPNTRSYLFHYGPLFSSQSSTYYDSSRMTSYGWSGDSITISGIDFRDAALYSSTSSVTCNFGDLSTSATSVSDNAVVCTVPAVDTSYWDTLVDVSLTFGAASSCSVDAQQFHFGPTIRSITPTRGYVAGETPVTIDGFAFGCCGITSYSCLFPEVTPAKTDDTVLASENSVTCTVPKNQYVDVLINNIGVAFTSTIFGTENLTFTEDDTALRYYYGPYVNSFSPTHTTLSGRDQYVVISGEGFADPYFLETFCDFFNETNPGFEFVPIEPLEEIYVTDTTITCKVPEFAHYPGAIDKIRPRWRRSVEELRPELFKNYYKTEAPAVVNENTAPYFSDGGSDTPVYLTGLYYGPVITSVCSGLLCNENLPRSSISGGLSINVTFDSLRDFVSSPAFNFGNEQALCIFGRRTADSFSIIHANPDNDNGGYVVCTTPAGDFNFDGEISVLLNPLYSMISDTTNTYHSSPYTTGISTNWVSSNGYEPIVVYGNGFCNYQTVRCIFSNGLTSNDATEGEITTDKMVTCRTPARSAGYSFISLQFCSSSDFDVCDCGSEQDYITVPDRVTFYGITGISPAEGSVCGGTTITFSGYGFYQFDRISCSWPNSASQTASILSDNLFTCVSLDVSPVFGNSEIHCSDISVVGIRDNYYYQLNVPSKFEAGLPQVVSISPSSQKINNFSQFTVSGLYFNANDLNVYCQFDNTTLTNATLTVSNGEYVVLCTPPSSLNVGTYDLELVFECSSNNEFTTNVVHFDVTQTPVIEKVRPISGPEIGGQTITISGYNFEGGSLYVCVFGDLIVGATYDETASQITCKTPAFLDTYEDVKVPLYISLDGGDTLFRSKDDYIYQNIAYVRDDNVCVKEEDFNAANQLSLSFVMTIFVVFISSLLNFF